MAKLLWIKGLLLKGFESAICAKTEQSRDSTERMQVLRSRRVRRILFSEPLFLRVAICRHSFGRLLREQITDVMGDAAVFIGGNDLDRNRAWDGADLLRDDGAVALICFRVERDSQKGELAADLFAHRNGMLADASGEDERVEAAGDGGGGGHG